MKRFAWLFLVFPLAFLRAAEPSLEEVLSEAREKNPDVRAAQGASSAAAARVSPAGTWPAPVLFYSREKSPGAAEGMNHFKAEQDIPFPGKLSNEEAMAHHEARLSESRSRAKGLEVAARARNAYVALYRSDRLIRAWTAGLEALRSALRSLEARVAGGSAPADEALSMRAEVGRMENDLWEEKQGRLLASIELNALLDRPVDAPWGMVQAPVLKELKGDLPSFLRRAEAQSPMFLAASHERNHASAMLSRARWEALPDFSLMFDHQTASGGMTGYEAGVGLKVPLWWSRPAGALREARAHVEETDASAEAMRNDVRRMVAMEFTEVHTHFEEARRYEADILPAAEGAFRLSLRRYESGRGDFTRMMEARRAWLEAERNYADQLAHFSEHWGLLESVVGASLDGPDEAPGAAPTEEHHGHQ